MLNSLTFLIVGVVLNIKGYIEFFEAGFIPSETTRPGIKLVEGLDAFMVGLIFMVFGMGIARLFLFDNAPEADLPGWLKFHDLKGLKVLLWETILVTLVIFSLSSLIKDGMHSWEALILPGVILILSLALFFMRWKEK